MWRKILRVVQHPVIFSWRSPCRISQAKQTGGAILSYSIASSLRIAIWIAYCLSVFQRAHCAICTDRIWGLGRQGYKCINCKLLVHKKCHKLVNTECGRHALPPVSDIDIYNSGKCLWKHMCMHSDIIKVCGKLGYWSFMPS